MAAPWREHLAAWPLPPAPFRLDPARTALVVVDVQRHAADPSVGMAAFFRERHPAVAEYYLDRLELVTIPALQRLLAFFRDRKLRVIFLCVGPLLEDGSDMTPRLRQRERLRGDAGGPQLLFHHGHPVHEVISQVAPREGELLLHKTTLSAFNSSGFDMLLRGLGLEYLVFTGLATQACVETTARHATDLGYNCVMVEDACITFSQATHDAALLNFAATFGRVDDSEAIIAELAAARPGPGVQ